MAKIKCAPSLPNDPFYKSTQWAALRANCLSRDNYTCVVPGCGKRATTADHIVSRRKGGADKLHNLRSLCREHDNMVKERPDGSRANKGRLRLKGVDATGAPLDREHGWNR